MVKMQKRYRQNNENVKNEEGILWIMLIASTETIGYTCAYPREIARLDRCIAAISCMER